MNLVVSAAYKLLTNQKATNSSDAQTQEEAFSRQVNRIFCLYPGRVRDPAHYVYSTEAQILKEKVRALQELDGGIPEHRLRALCTAANTESSEQALYLLLVILRLNLVGAFDEREQSKIGELLPQLGCFLNHSCDPNAITFFRKDTGVYEVRAIRSIVRGEEVTVPYTSLYQYRADRQLDLQRNYGFVCVCIRCEGDADEQPSRLDDTPPIMHDEERSAEDRRAKQQRLDALYRGIATYFTNEAQSGDHAHTKSLKAARMWLKEATGFYAALHPQYYKVIEFLTQALCEMGQYEKALPYAERQLAMLDMVFPRFWFRKSCVLAVLSSLHSHFGDAEKASKLAHKRKVLLNVTRGVDDWPDGSERLLRKLE
jgi:hypothetical protein